MSGEFAAVAPARADYRYPERRPLRQVLNSLVGALGLLLLGVSGSEAHEAKDGVSRTPIRRVLHKLEFEGLVRIKNGVGTIVTDIDLKTFKETYDLRMRAEHELTEREVEWGTTMRGH